jgi:hypothetical protein
MEMSHSAIAIVAHKHKTTVIFAQYPFQYITTDPISLRAAVQYTNTDSSDTLLRLRLHYSQLSQLTCLLLSSSSIWALNQIVTNSETVILSPYFCLLSEEKRGPTYRELSVL